MQRFLSSSLIVLCLFVLIFPALAQSSPLPVPPDARHYRVFDGEGRPATLDQLVEHCKNVNVVFWGEEHNDAVGHALQALFFQKLISRYRSTRQVALSLEMFERDTQVVLDEYLSGLITEPQFLNNSRSWANYQDYKPLVLLAKDYHLPVIAANAPRRYVNLVARWGRSALNLLSPQAKSWLAPLPYPAASAAYARRFAALMSGMAGTGIEAHRSHTDGHSHNVVNSNLIDSQALWDATMADSLTRFLKVNKRSLILHINGKFHSDHRLGTVEQLLAYSRRAKACVVTAISSSGFPDFEPQTQLKSGDFVILTDPEYKRNP
jgi:uncharacterized iron-regulated protein